MIVQRVLSADGTVSHIEPRWDETWSNLEKLRWSAAVVRVDTGLHLEVDPCIVRHKPSRFSPWIDLEAFSVRARSGASVHTGMDFQSAWDFLSGCAFGAEQARWMLA